VKLLVSPFSSAYLESRQTYESMRHLSALIQHAKQYIQYISCFKFFAYYKTLNWKCILLKENAAWNTQMAHVEDAIGKNCIALSTLQQNSQCPQNTSAVMATQRGKPLVSHVNAI